MPPIARFTLPPGPSVPLLVLVSRIRCGVSAVYTEGVGTVKVYWSADDVALVPAGLVTVTSTVPAECAGLTTWNKVSAKRFALVAGVVPNLIEVPPAQKPGRVMTTLAPPAVVPLLGLTPVTVGAAVPPYP